VRIHHLNCGTMHSPGAKLVCHVLLIETDAGLVLVDTGFGLEDCERPRQRLGIARHIVRPILDPEETAIRQIERLGFKREDVRHIVMTHFDFDHVGGLSDFPHAQVHVTAAEALGAVHNPSQQEARRFRAAQFAHGPKLVEYEPTGESWRGFEAVRELEGVASGIVMIMLPGHTRGHVAVAVDTGSGWLLHCGDAFYVQGMLEPGARVPWTLNVADRFMTFDRAQALANRERLAELWLHGDPDLFMFSAHDPELFEFARDRSSS
jgi:glyoxylase-like metal-dependent hydrolase (beta-lactamase superfamily II)